MKKKHSNKNIVLLCVVTIVYKVMCLNLIYREFYKLLIIGNFQATILHMPTGNNGIMEWWNNSISCISCQEESSGKTCGPNRLRRRRIFARRAPSHHSNYERSELSSNDPKILKDFFFTYDTMIQ